MFILIVPVFLLLCYKWGDWKNWKLYYPTILYMMLIDFLNNFITARYPLWEYEKIFKNNTFNDIVVAFTLYPSTVLLYLHHYPKKPLKQIAYIALWVLIYAAIEFVALETGTFSYQNGWNFVWAIGFDIMMFIILKLHYEKPLLAWPISAVLMAAVYYILKLPVNDLR